jgi:hypothetical protein
MSDAILGERDLITQHLVKFMNELEFNPPVGWNGCRKFFLNK